MRALIVSSVVLLSFAPSAVAQSTPDGPSTAKSREVVGIAETETPTLDLTRAVEISKKATLSSQEQGRMNELLASAEQRLHDGDYFSAERRFERARVPEAVGSPVTLYQYVVHGEDFHRRKINRHLASFL